METDYFTISNSKAVSPEGVRYHIYSYRSPVSDGGSGELEALSIYFRSSDQKWLLQVASGFSEFFVIPELDEREDLQTFELPGSLITAPTWIGFMDWAKEAVNPLKISSMLLPP